MTDRWVEANPRESQSQTRSGEPQEVLEQGRDKLRKPGWEVVRSRMGEWTAGCWLTALPQPVFAFLMGPSKRLVFLTGPAGSGR